MNQNEMFSIRQVIELTGLSEFTIRGWENRYSAFKPKRSESGRREYTKNDVERALLLRELLKRGYKISKIAQLSSEKLQNLFGKATDNSSSEEGTVQNKLVDEVLEFAALQKWTELARLFNKVNYKEASEFIHLFFLPLLSELSSQIQKGVVSIAQEHVLSSFIKEKIYSVLSSVEAKRKMNVSSVRFVLATPEGDYHEIGLLLAHLLIRSYGYTSLFLGPHSPAQDIAETTLRYEASHLLIVSTVSKKQGASKDLLNFISDVQKKSGPHLKILLAGGQAPLNTGDKHSPLISLHSFSVFESYLNSLKVKKQR